MTKEVQIKGIRRYQFVEIRYTVNKFPNLLLTQTILFLQIGLCSGCQYTQEDINNNNNNNQKKKKGTKHWQPLLMNQLRKIIQIFICSDLPAITGDTHTHTHTKRFFFHSQREEEESKTSLDFTSQGLSSQ